MPNRAELQPRNRVEQWKTRLAYTIMGQRATALLHNLADKLNPDNSLSVTAGPSAPLLSWQIRPRQVITEPTNPLLNQADESPSTELPTVSAGPPKPVASKTLTKQQATRNNKLRNILAITIAAVGAVGTGFFGCVLAFQYQTCLLFRIFGYSLFSHVDYALFIPLTIITNTLAVLLPTIGLLYLTLRGRTNQAEAPFALPEALPAPQEPNEPTPPAEQTKEAPPLPALPEEPEDMPAPQEPNSATGAKGAEDDSTSAVPKGIFIGNQGQYKATEKLGHGGQGDVFKGINIKTNEIVVIKTLTEERYRQATSRDGSQLKPAARLTQEFAIQSRIEHSNIEKAIDLGISPDNFVFIAKRFIPGTTLKAYIDEQKTQGQEPAKRVASSTDIIGQVIKALSTVAKDGVGHRDIKPGNIMITPDGHVVLIDFGIAKDVGFENENANDEERLTTKLAVMGTVQYLDPYNITYLKEYVTEKSQKLTEAQKQAKLALLMKMDMYALGMVLYELLTNEVPFRVKGLGDYTLYVGAVVSGNQEFPNKISQGTIPDELFMVISRLLSGKLENRYDSYEELDREFQLASQGLDINQEAKAEAFLDRTIAAIETRPSLTEHEIIILEKMTSEILGHEKYQAREEIKTKAGTILDHVQSLIS